MTNSGIIILGSNINPRKNISYAFEILQERFRVLKKTGILKTKPIGISDQPYFLNAALMLRTDLTHDQLVIELKKIEDELGRDRNREKFGPREIDLDVIIWNQQVVDDDYYERDFLRKLVADLKEAE